MSEKKPNVELHHVAIYPAENGWRVEHHMIEQHGEKRGIPSYPTDYPNKTEEHVFGKAKDMMDHLANELTDSTEGTEEGKLKKETDKEDKFTLAELSRAHKAGTKKRGIVKGDDGDGDGDEADGVN